jgi:hypothetical protein
METKKNKIGSRIEREETFFWKKEDTAAEKIMMTFAYSYIFTLLYYFMGSKSSN